MIIIIIITRFQSEDQVCISTTLRELDKSVLTQRVMHEDRHISDMLGIVATIVPQLI